MLSANLAFRYSADLQSLAYERKEKMTSQLGFLLMLAVVVIAGGTLGFGSNQDNPTWGGGLNWTMYVLGFLAYLGGAWLLHLALAANAVRGNYTYSPLIYTAIVAAGTVCAVALVALLSDHFFKTLRGPS